MNSERPTPKAFEKGLASLEPVRMPWIYFIDPVTGELPPDWEEKMMKKTKGVQKKVLSPLVPQKLKPSDLVDPDAGKKFDNGKVVKASNKNAVQPISTRGTIINGNQKKKLGPLPGSSGVASKASTKFPKPKTAISNLPKPSTSNVPNAAKEKKLCAGYNVSKPNSKKPVNGFNTRQFAYSKTTDNGIRKKLFVSPKAKNSARKSQILVNIISPTPPTTKRCDDTLPLLEAASEMEITQSEPKSPPAESLEPPTLPVDLPSPKSDCSSGSSTREFLRLEQMCKTPKSKTKTPKKACVCDRCDFHIAKVTEIMERLTEQLEECKQVLGELKNCGDKGSCRKRRFSSANKENRPASSKKKTVDSILTSAKKKRDLRVDVLKKNVTFDMENRHASVGKALDLYNTVRATCPMLGTPKILKSFDCNTPPHDTNDLSNIIQKQCLLLQTPK